MADTALAHCTQTDQCQEATVVTHTDKRLVIYFPKADAKVTLFRTDVRKPYVGQMGRLEFTVMDADIE